MLTAKRLREVLIYDPQTGHFFWRQKRSHFRAGDRAGTPKEGYTKIAIDGRQYRAARLAWLFVYGRFPDSPLDHINRNRADDRIANLREATQSQNNANASIRSDNASGYRGVYFCARTQRWAAKIQRDGRCSFLGRHPTPELAAAAYDAAAIKQYGEFANLNGVNV